MPALLPFLLCVGGENAISGDRPGFLNSSTLVPLGMLQLETGASFARGDGAPDALATPTGLRYGFREDLELRASSSGWNHLDRNGASDEDGWGGLTLGVKGVLDRHWADLDLSGADSAAWVAEITLPTGSFEPAPHSPVPTLSAVASWTPAGSAWQWCGTAGLTWIPDSASLVFDLALSATRPLGGSTSLYLESGWFPGINTDSNPLFVGTGLIALASNDVQLDFSVDTGVAGASGDWLVGAGLCWRW